MQCKDQNTQEVKENAFLTGQNMHIFEEVLLFQATYKIRNRKTSELIVCFYVVHSLAKEDFL